MLTFNSVADIYDSLDRARARLERTLDGLSADDANSRPSPDRWTIAEIVEHLSLVEGQISRLMSKILDKVEAGGGLALGGSAPPAPLVDFAPFAERAEEKFNAPETARPKGGVGVEDSLARLRESSEAIRLLRPRVESLDLSATRLPHPAFGQLNFYQWLAVLGIHEERHRRQIEALKESINAAAAAQD